MIKIYAELRDGNLTISSESKDISVLDVYLVLATIMRDFAGRLNTEPLNLLEEIKVLITLMNLEIEKEEEL